MFLYHLVFYLKALRESFYDSFEVSTRINEHYQVVQNNSELPLVNKNEEAALDRSKSISQNVSNCEDNTATHDNYVMNRLRDWIKLHQSVMG